MKFLTRLAWGLGVLMAFAGVGFAAPDSPVPARKADYSLLPISLLNTLTPLTADQSTKISAIQDKLKSDLQSLHQPGQRETPDQRAQERGLRDKATTDIAAALTSSQTAALEADEPMLRLLTQSRVVPERALPNLNLTSDQVSQIKALADAAQIQQKALDDDHAEKLKAIQADFKTKVAALLTPEQQAAIAQPPPRLREQKPKTP